MINLSKVKGCFLYINFCRQKGTYNPQYTKKPIIYYERTLKGKKNVYDKLAKYFLRS